MADSKCEGCGETSRCEFCGRFMAHFWFRPNDEPDGWEDYWLCSQQEKHKREHPRDWDWGAPETKEQQ